MCRRTLSLVKEPTTTPSDQLEAIRSGYAFDGPAMQLGAAVGEGGRAHPDVQVNLPLPAHR